MLRPEERRDRRERNPYRQHSREFPNEADWANREGEELGYQRMYGEYGSNARGWVDKPHEPNWSVRRSNRASERGSNDEYQSYETYEDYSGVAPKSYQRSDEKLIEAISESLTWSPDVDATDITIAVKNGEAILTGTVPERSMIYIVDELMDEIYGLKNYENRLKRKKNI